MNTVSRCACCRFILFKFIICIACRIIIHFQLLLLVYMKEQEEEEEEKTHTQVHIFKEIVISDMIKEHDRYILGR